MILIDHKDSFTWNLVHLLEAHEPVLVIDFSELKNLDPKDEILVFSPGPGCPDDYPESCQFYWRHRRTNPILGICLGFQIIAQVEGCQISPQPQILHGVETSMPLLQHGISFQGLQSPQTIARYHALGTLGEGISQDFSILAKDPESQTLLAIENKKGTIAAFQFHPDSFLTPNGEQIISNIITHFQRIKPLCQF